jgi:hypothetical protein
LAKGATRREKRNHGGHARTVTRLRSDPSFG